MMFKFFTLCFLAVFAVVAAKPGVIAPLAYSAPLVAASSPYAAAAYTASYASPYVASSPYVVSSYPYASAAYSAYPSFATAQVLVR